MFLKSLNIRIAALFSGVFVFASALLFAVFYLFQYNILVQEDRNNLESRTLEFWAVYSTGGAVAVQQALNIESFLTDYDPFLLRIADRTNRQLAIYYPASWRDYSIDNLSEPGVKRISRIGGKEHLDIASLPLPDGNILQIGMSSARRQTLLARFRTIYALVLLPIIVISFGGGIFFSNRTLKPINRLIALTRSIIETGKMNERLPLSGRGDELDELTDLFNRMLKQIEALLEAMRMSLDNVAHDLRTPLTRLRQRIETAAEALGEDASAGALVEAGREAERIQSMLKTLMDISEAETGVMRLSKKAVSLAVVVGDLTEFYSYLAEERNLTMRCTVKNDAMVHVDVDRLRQVITNLLDNAVKYTPSGGSIEISVSRDEANAKLVVADSGIGIPEEDIPHIWDRLFRGDRSRTAPGLGLGLGLVRAVVEAHGGTVGVKSTPGAGSEFAISLPL